MGKPQVTSFRISSRLDGMAHAVAQVEAAAARTRLGKSEIADVAICASELINNAIVHGNHLDPARGVKVDIEVTDTAIRVTVSDEGSGFDPVAVPDPIAKENLERESGRGIFICQHLMDEVIIDRTEAGGTRCCLLKRISPASSS